MALADLKKNVTSSNVAFIKPVSLEDFIEDASRYAMGEAALASKHSPIALTLVSAHQQPIHKTPNRKSKNATFSLNETVIQQLTELATHQGIAKSRLIRDLIEQEYQAMKDSKKAQSAK
ncbi:replication protein RepA [Shewanella gelidii]|uniref:Replication protein RepA n=1 Tax=Shewanella gelidii TaxID=1642821 RepID=A0A917JKR9_9GAMM|nr:replication protein RepA [Shewanella gelidii]MCL1096528.1 replication protein RepA [Shewanella gelidii]GGI68087.1 replication protein RepA [Shewanella gelidii]